MERANREIETEREEEEKRLLSNKMKDFKSLKTLKDIFAINEFSFMEKNFRY